MNSFYKEPKSKIKNNILGGGKGGAWGRGLE